MRTLRIVNYAVNGAGVGHLTRLVAINRWLRRYTQHAGVRAEIYFLTSCEADGLLFGERFASFKLPSKTIVGDAGIDKASYLALAKQWVWHSLGLLRPDLFIVDSFPRGSFGELLSALDLARQRAFIYRPMKVEIAGKADFQAMLPLYDSILVPEHEAAAGTLVPPSLRSRVRWLGPMLVRERVELCSRAEARKRLGVPAEAFCVYVTAGGGGDPGAEQQLTSAIDALLTLPGVHVVVGAGPLYRGARHTDGVEHAGRVSWLSRPGAAELFAGLDVAVSAAGYNSFSELMHLGVPAIFLPQPKIADEQDVRAARAVAAGAALMLERGPDFAERLRAAVESFRAPEARARAAAAARAFIPQNHARDAAAELLRLCLPASEVEAAEEAVTDDLLAAARAQGRELGPFFEVMHALSPPSEDTAPDTARRRRGPLGDQPAEVSALAVSLLAHVHEQQIPLPAALRVTQAMARKLPLANAGERAAAARLLLGKLAVFDDWAGATTLLKVLGVEKQLSGPELADELGGFLGNLRERGHDLYRGVALLSGAQAADADAASNKDLLAAATRRLDAGAG